MTKDEQWLLKEKYEGINSEAFRIDCKRLETGEPLGYIIGHVPFLDCTIYLDNQPLIPRPETEWWTEKALEVMRQAKSSSLRVLDLCAGSGAVGVAVAKQCTEARVDFVEINPRLLPTIRKNININVNINVDIRTIESDLFSELSGRYDFILTNPPYIDPALDRATESVKTYEPHQALYGGNDGIEIIAKIIKNAPDYLTPRGQLWIEHEPEQASALHELSATHNFSATTHRDQFGVERYSVLVLQ